MINYYERIQKSIDYIEKNLENEIDLNIACQEAYMSLSSFYRIFFAIVGYKVKEYVRLRRISLAASDFLSSGATVMDATFKYGFESPDAFSRAFKRITGFLPSEFKKDKNTFSFERINILDKYFEVQDKNLLKKYPDIKVLKKLEPMRVAYCNYFGENPETNAFAIMKEWLLESGLNLEDLNLRIFGYNNPNPSSGQTEYGYEVCITIGNITVPENNFVKTKILEGGLYAVSGIKRKNEDIGVEIVKAWQRFQNWLTDSKYAYGGHQWLEEHLGFDEHFNHMGGIDLYMPIVEKGKVDTKKEFVNVEPIYAAVYTAKGENAADEARNYILDWAKQEGLFKDGKEHRFFAYYDHEKIGNKAFWFKMHISVDKDFKTDDENIAIEEFKGGYFASMKSKLKYNSWCWGEFINWLNKSKEYALGNFWFFEEYRIEDSRIDMETDMELFLPICETSKTDKIDMDVLGMQSFHTYLRKSENKSGLTIIDLPFNASEIFNVKKGTIKVYGTINGIQYRNKLISRGNGKYIMTIDKNLQKSLGFTGEELKLEVTMDLDSNALYGSGNRVEIRNIECNLDVITAIKTRHSIRNFKNKKIEEIKIQKIIEAGFCAPSSKNKRPWHFIVSTDVNFIKNQANNSNKQAFNSATCSIIVCGDKNIDGTNEFLIESCSAATQNILLAAHGIGLGGTWFGISRSCGSYDYIRGFFNLPEKIIPVAIIALGYPDEEKTSEPRYDDTKVHWERW